MCLDEQGMWYNNRGQVTIILFVRRLNHINTEWAYLALMYPQRQYLFGGT
jgi:hypothetical protein